MLSGCNNIASSSAPHNRNSIMFCCKSAVALHESEINWRAELLTKLVKMPLMHYYRNLRSE